MTAIRLASGQIMLHSPCHITAEIAEEILVLALAAHIVVPGNFHHPHATLGQSALRNHLAQDGRMAEASALP